MKIDLDGGLCLPEWNEAEVGISLGLYISGTKEGPFTREKRDIHSAECSHHPQCVGGITTCKFWQVKFAGFKWNWAWEYLGGCTFWRWSTIHQGHAILLQCTWESSLLGSWWHHDMKIFRDNVVHMLDSNESEYGSISGSLHTRDRVSFLSAEEYFYNGDRSLCLLHSKGTTCKKMDKNVWLSLSESSESESGGS